ncbi:MAG: ATP-binding protein [Nitrospiraceae bacterium]|nr:ATP-binding protein [Nitrospiraceae bacterium]
MNPERECIPVTVDKSHIITIGERLYTESIEFIREIVNNAYDADATLVDITVSEDSIEIRDNGAGMDRRFELNDIESRIIEGTPLKAPNFRVKLNNHTITPRSLTGHKIPFLEGTEFGPVHGEIIVLPQTLASTDELGIEIKVKQVTVRRELFGMETWGKIMARVRGEVNADFLPITSDRTGFIKDSSEFRAFLAVMEKVIEEIKKVLYRLTAKKEGRIVSRALNEALHRVYIALSHNPELSPFGALPIADEATKGIGGAGPLSEKKAEGSGAAPPTGKEKIPEKKKRKKNPQVKRLTPNAVIKKMKFGQYGVSCIVDSFGEEGPEVFTEETTIYINRDHPLYKRESAKADTHTLNLARLITQEIALMKDSKNPRQAFERQSRLLKDAFIEKEKID